MLKLPKAFALRIGLLLFIFVITFQHSFSQGQSRLLGWLSNHVDSLKSSATPKLILEFKDTIDKYCLNYPIQRIADDIFLLVEVARELRIDSVELWGLEQGAEFLKGQQKYYECLEYALRMEKLSTKPKYKRYRQKALCLQFNVFNSLGLDELSDQIVEKLKRDSSGLNPLSKMWLAMDLGKSYYEQGRFDQFQSTYFNAIEEFKYDEELQEHAGFMYYSMAYLYIGKKRYQEALASIDSGNYYYGDRYQGLVPLFRHNIYCVYYSALGDTANFHRHRHLAKPLINSIVNPEQMDFLEAKCYYVATGKFSKLYDTFIALRQRIIAKGSLPLYFSMCNDMIDIAEQEEEHAIVTNIEASLLSFENLDPRTLESDSGHLNENSESSMSMALMLLAWITFLLLFVIGFTYFMIRRRGATYRAEQTIKNIESNQQVVSINRINAVLKDPKVLCDPNLNLVSLADKLSTNRSTLSYSINIAQKGNFKLFIAEKRINRFCELAVKSKLENYKVEVLAEMVGYRSRATFSKHFKHFKGVSPGEYLRDQRANAKFFSAR